MSTRIDQCLYCFSNAAGYIYPRSGDERLSILVNADVMRSPAGASMAGKTVRAHRRRSQLHLSRMSFPQLPTSTR